MGIKSPPNLLQFQNYYEKLLGNFKLSIPNLSCYVTLLICSETTLLMKMRIEMKKKNKALKNRSISWSIKLEIFKYVDSSIRIYYAFFTS